MKQHLSIAVLAVWLLLCTYCIAAQHVVDSLAGSYEFSSGSAPRDIYVSVIVSREDDGYVLGFQGAHPDAHGAAPEGGGTGRVGSDGVLRFTYEDAFSNRGSGTFRRTRRGYELSIRISEVADSRCLLFYGDVTLQRTKPKKRSG